MSAAAILITATSAALVVAAGVTGAALAYARRCGMLDQPGRRRSHSTPTPRGGGVGIVAAVLLAGVPAWYMLDPATGYGRPALFALAMLAVALVGWRDDHAPLAVLPRLAVHAGSALLVGALVLAPPASRDPAWWWALVVLVPLLVGGINAHNFMDGIDGILGMQGMFVLLGFGLLAAWRGDAGITGLALAAAAGCLGFLMFNLPPARIFMGDVGSGTLGLLIGATAAVLVQRHPAMLWACLILPSAFLVDSGLTLTRRVLAGERWYVPHRQHLYQWLVRIKWSHGRTGAAYMAWNLVVVAPMAWLAAWWPGRGGWLALAVYAAAAGVWHFGKRACLAAASGSGQHEVA